MAVGLGLLLQLQLLSRLPGLKNSLVEGKNRSETNKSTHVHQRTAHSHEYLFGINGAYVYVSLSLRSVVAALI